MILLYWLALIVCNIERLAVAGAGYFRRHAARVGGGDGEVLVFCRILRCRIGAQHKDLWLAWSWCLDLLDQLLLILLFSII